MIFTLDKSEIDDLFSVNIKRFKISKPRHIKIKEDGEFWNIITQFGQALNINKKKFQKKSVICLHDYLQNACEKMVLKNALQEEDLKDGYFGSDSEGEIEMKEKNNGIQHSQSNTKIKFYSKKMRQLNGMMAINVAYYVARLYLNGLDPKDTHYVNIKTKPEVDCNNMYYEIKDCLNLADVYSIKEKLKIIKKNEDEIFKLNNILNELQNKIKQLENEGTKIENMERIVNSIKTIKDEEQKIEVRKSELLNQFQFEEYEKKLLHQAEKKLKEPLNDNKLLKEVDLLQNEKSHVLMFDLNSFEVKSSLTLEQTLKSMDENCKTPKVVILDWTSSKTSQVRDSVHLLMKNR